MSGLATAAAIGATLMAIGRLAATDPKRRRAFRMPPHRGRRHAATLAVLALGPGILLLMAGTGAGFLVWLGAATVAGWAIAAVSPVRTADAASRLAARLATVTGRPRRMLHAWLARAAPRVGDDAAASRIVELERRVALLEAMIATARAGGALPPADDGVARIADFQTARAQRVGDA